MLMKRFLALVCTLALTGSAWADTPIGPGATGTGGTGPNAADSGTRTRDGGGAGPKRQDAVPVDESDSKVRASPGAAPRTRDGNTSNTGTGSTSGAGVSGNAGKVQGERKADEK